MIRYAITDGRVFRVAWVQESWGQFRHLGRTEPVIVGRDARSPLWLAKLHGCAFLVRVTLK